MDTAPRSPPPPLAQDPRLGVAATPMAFICAIADAYRLRGLSPAKALTLAHIAPQQLHQEEACVTALQLELMSAAAMQELDDEALGWFSRRLPWGSYGMLCRASLGAADLGLAIRRWCRHHRLLTEDVSMRLETADGRATLSLHRTAEPPGLSAGMREFCSLALLRYLLGYACWAVDSRIVLQGAGLPFSPPAHAGVYPLLFSCPVRFDQACAWVSFDADYLALPLRRDSRALDLMLKRALPLTVLQYRRDRLLVQRVREALRAQTADLGSQGLTAEAIASRLNLSSRTLHRQLREEGASLQQLKDEVRFAIAAELLTRSRRPVKQIALAAGFNNEKSFSRAFRSWSGKSPLAYRDGSG